jgi:hypothetical protein
MDELFRAVVEEVALEGLEGTPAGKLWDLLRKERDIELDSDVCRSLSHRLSGKLRDHYLGTTLNPGYVADAKFRMEPARISWRGADLILRK